MIQAIVTDIEGTTTSLSFVKEVLFPYARERMEGFVRRHGAEPAVVSLLEEVKAAVDDETLSLEKIIAQLHAWIDADAKIAALKSLQGLLWQEGYQRGDFTSHLYPDAEHGLRAWQEAAGGTLAPDDVKCYRQIMTEGEIEYPAPPAPGQAQGASQAQQGPSPARAAPHLLERYGASNRFYQQPV